mmetsp:Transcript_48004/g.82513  ORF Transcript_48004/g.82513 Transcript_48004/m.82513 type:complete len:195 (-) Transcript_48004:140-724(-)
MPPRYVAAPSVSTSSNEKAMEVQHRARDSFGSTMKRKRPTLEKIMSNKKKTGAKISKKPLCSFCQSPGHRVSSCKARQQLGVDVKKDDLALISELSLKPVKVPREYLTAPAEGLKTTGVQHIQLHGILNVDGQGKYVDLSFVDYQLAATKAAQYFPFDALQQWFRAKSSKQLLLRTKEISRLPFKLTLRLRRNT